MATTPREPVRVLAYEPDGPGEPEGFRGSRGPARPAPGKEPLSHNIAMLVSVLVHGVAIVGIGLSALLQPHRPSVVPVFELVNLDPPKLRPLTPKTIKPPVPPPPEPEPVKAPEAPMLTPKPTKAVTPKPEPKVVKPKEDDEPKPVKEVVQEQQVLPQPQVQMSVPAGSYPFLLGRAGQEKGGSALESAGGHRRSRPGQGGHHLQGLAGRRHRLGGHLPVQRQLQPGRTGLDDH